MRPLMGVRITFRGKPSVFFHFAEVRELGEFSEFGNATTARALDSMAAASNVMDPSQRELVSLSVDGFGSFHLMTADGEQELLGKQSLLRELKAVRRASGDARLEITVEPDVQLQSMVDAIDASTIAGFTTMNVIQSEYEGA